MQSACQSFVGLAGDGEELLRKARAHRPDVAIADVGCLLKHRVADRRSFCADVERVAAGGTVVDPEVVAALLERSQPVARRILTERQGEVPALMAEGRSNLAIAERLTISEKAAVRHASQVYNRLGLPPRPGDPPPGAGGQPVARRLTARRRGHQLSQ